MAEFYVKVRPGSNSFRIEPGHIHKVYLTEPAEQGRANTELLRELGKVLGTRPGIVSGHSSRRKRLCVDMDEEEVMRRLQESGNE